MRKKTATKTIEKNVDEIRSRHLSPELARMVEERHALHLEERRQEILAILGVRRKGWRI